jgi:septum site-determining protein MinC
MPKSMPREEPAFKIKNVNLPVLVLHLKTPDMARVRAQLATRIKQMPDFFAHTPVALGLAELAGLANSDAALDLASLLDFMRGHRMQAVGVIGGSAAQREAAALAGLGIIPETPARPAAVTEAAPEPVVEAPPAPPAQDLGPAQPDLPGLEVEAAPAPLAPPEARPTLVIDKPVRTGQRIYAEGGNLVVLAIVNAGAELIADGDIHIYAPLRGRALAGARGNTAARIYVQSMEAELVAIAGYFQVFDEGIPDAVRGKFSQVYLDGEKVMVKAMSSKR